MFRWNQYRHLHVVRNLKNLVGKIWNSDVLFINEKEFSNPLNEKYFHNPFVAQLLKDQDMNRALFNFLQQKTSSSKEVSLFTWDLVGLSILAIPIFTNQKWVGLVAVTGFIHDSSQLEKVQKSAQKIGCVNVNISMVQHEQLEIMKNIVSSLTQEIMLVSHLENIKKDVHRKFNRSEFCYGDIIGQSAPMKNLYSVLDKIRQTDSSVLIQGENGTGKELVAQSIYQNSLRKKEAFIVQNCSAFNDNLLESELFGHVKGAFTGAIQDKIGLFELADKGTFFLDEIGDTSLAMQAKLLRVLQEGTFFPVGSVRPKKVNVRIIAATNKDLSVMMKQGLFREDLYYRLNVINIKVPPLRERKQDIQLLSEYFLLQEAKEMKKTFDSEIFKYFKNYSWPGNVRELHNEVLRMIILSHSNIVIGKGFLSPKILDENNISSASSSEQKLKEAIKSLEKEMIGRCLKEQSWNKTRVAKKLGISRAALISKVKIYDLEKKSIA